mmetsp:Transcript_17532/g.45842  ORF Transcript_17532/g.45842 Transcript_17532/m.45842 type:complete len:149 (-) Transcript_17532:28-474(-)
MGQQQLLLVILVTIIVGIATVVAINTFSSASDSSNVDAVRQDVITFASSAQGYYMKPAMLGGGGNSFTGITFAQVAFPATEFNGTNTVALNSNGVYAISNIQDSVFTITAHPVSRISTPVSLTAVADEGNAELVANITPNGVTWTDNE